MKKAVIGALGVLALAAALWVGLSFVKMEWPGVDEAVVEKFAREANRPPREPFINTEKGDLLLFFFLVAGAAGGFMGGYYFRELFPPKPRKGPTDA